MIRVFNAYVRFGTFVDFQPSNKETFIIANHPSGDGIKDLLSLKIIPLKSRATELGIDLTSIDQTKKSEIRKKIWQKSDLNLELQKILIKDEDTKKIAEKIETYIPSFSLFNGYTKLIDPSF